MIWRVALKLLVLIAFIAVARAPGAIAPACAEDTPQVRNFYDVLEDVMGDFEFDLKNGNVSGLKDLSLRNVALSENVPSSFKQHLELRGIL